MEGRNEEERKWRIAVVVVEEQYLSEEGEEGRKKVVGIFLTANVITLKLIISFSNFHNFNSYIFSSISFLCVVAR